MSTTLTEGQTDVREEERGAHELDSFFSPASVAIIGASPDATKIRGKLLSFLRKNGYPGRVFPVNPSYTEIDGIACYPSIGAIDIRVDLAIVAIPAGGVLAALEECAAAGVQHAVIISSGFAEEGGASAEVQQEIASLARRTGIRISGPNAEGFFSEPGRISATFSPAVDTKPSEPRMCASEQRVGIIAQSGGIGFALYNRGRAIGLNFSHVVSTGNEADLTAGDFLDYMVHDSETAVVILFLEGIRDPETFLTAADRAAKRGKPVIVAKVGRSGAGERAAASHTASMAGWSAAYEAIFAKYGFISVSDPDEAVAIAATLTTAPLPQGNRAAIITVSGGGGAWAADALEGHGLQVPELSAPLQERISTFIPSYGSPCNPVDITAQAAHTGGFQKSIDILNESDEVDLIIVVTSLASDTRISVDPAELRHTIASRRKPILFYSYTLPSHFARSRLAEAGVIVHSGLNTVSAAIQQLVRRGQYQQALTAITPELDPALMAKARAHAGPWSEYDTKQLLREAGIALPTECLVLDGGELAQVMSKVGFPLAMKVQSPDIPHKSEVGGVRLGIADEAAGVRAYKEIISRARSHWPDADFQGVLVSPMSEKGIEIIIGVIQDRAFGPILMVGFGGIMTELFHDVVYRPAPVSEKEAADLLKDLKAAPLLQGFRGAPRADVPALTALIARISGLAAGLKDEIAEIELNPVVVHAEGGGVTIVDALAIPFSS